MRIAPARAEIAPARGVFPSQALEHLDALWIQVAGTLCNLACTHCFVSCGPGEARHALMSRAEVAARVAEALRFGGKEFYFTGGEPFMHREFHAILEDTLAHGPCTVLTNGTLFSDERIAALARMSGAARYSLEIRVSLDGADAAGHDAYRGTGTFARTLAALRALEAAGLLPIVTATRPEGEDAAVTSARFASMLRTAGIRRPRLKLLPMFRLGREATRTRGYEAIESLRDLPEASFDPARLQCRGCRAVSATGVHVCPLLVDESAGRMGDTLAAALGPFTLSHGACYTCYVTGMTCGNG